MILNIITGLLAFAFATVCMAYGASQFVEAWDKRPKAAAPEAKQRVVAEYELPPEGPPIGASRNEVWETVGGRIVQISAPIRGCIAGVELPKQTRGPHIFLMPVWRNDGVSLGGDRQWDLLRARPDIEPHFRFNEDGYVMGPADTEEDDRRAQ